MRRLTNRRRGMCGKLPRCRAMTLIEMVISLSMLTVILASSVSLVLVAAKAMSSEASNTATDAVTARLATDQIIDDLKTATAITEQTTTAITMIVPDRDADGTAEVIRYAWNGLTGAPLTRQYNSRTPATIASNVHATNFTYLTKTVGKPPAIEGTEQSIAAHDATTSANWVGYQLADAKGAAGSIAAPAMPATAVTWRPTRCRVMLQRTAGSTGTVTVALKYADSSGAPMGAVLTSGVTLIEAASAEAGWVAIPFGTAIAVEPGRAVCLVVSYVKVTGLTGGYVTADGASSDSTSKFRTTVDGGATWTVQGASSLQFGLWGTVSTQGAETLDFQPLPNGP